MRRHGAVGFIEANAAGTLLKGLLLAAVAVVAVFASTGTASAAKILGSPTVSNVLSGSAEVSIEIDTEGQSVIVNLSDQEYPLQPQGYHFVKVWEVEPSSAPVVLSWNITGLRASTKYAARFDTNEVASVDFTTLPAAPPVVISLEAPAELTDTTAAVAGEVERPAGSDPGFDVTCNFEYIPDDLYNLARNEQQEFTLNNATGGTYTLTFGSPAQTTAPLAFDASGAQIQSALEALSSIGPGGVSVAGGGSNFLVEFTGPLAGKDLSESIGADPSGLNEGAYIVGEVVTEGRTAQTWQEAGKTACVPPVLTADGVSSVTARLKGLSPNTAYRYRLSGSNAGGSDSLEGAALFVTKATPIVETLGVSALGSTTAGLGGQVNPANSQEVTYQFEWGTTNAYGHLAPANPASLPFTDNSFHSVHAPIAGLQPSTEYHYRLVATNTQTGEVGQGRDRTFTTLAAAGPVTCPNESSRTGFSAGLPDCRALEWVTPDISNANILTGELPAFASADGSSIQYVTNDAPEIATSSTINSPVVSEKAPGGWRSRGIGALSPEPAVSFGAIVAEGLISADRKQGLFYSTNDLSAGDVPGELNLFKLRADGSAVQLTTVGEEIGFGKPAQYDYGLGLARASEDFSHIFFSSSPRQLAEDPLEYGNTYDWSEEDGLKLLGILPAEGSTPEAPAPYGAVIGEGSLPGVSRDGSRVLFEARNSGFEPVAPLYLRIDGEETVEVSAPAPGAPDTGPAKNLRTVGITSDGSTVLFTSSSELTPDADTGGGKGADLYSYDVDSATLTDLTADADPEDERGADVFTNSGFGSLPYVTKDGSTVYFVAKGNLAPGATSGQLNLFVMRGGDIRFIASAVGLGVSGINQQFRTKGFYATANGDYLAFVSNRDLTGYDTGGLDEVYKYAYATGSIECASCRPSGDLPAAGSQFSFLTMFPRAVSQDGSRVFFTSEDALLPGLTNGTPRVFEYTHGNVSLLSPADLNQAVNLLDASSSGDDVFLASYEELVPGAGHNFAIYDARVNADPFVPSAAECQGEGCRGVGTAPPASANTASAQFEAPGELIAPRSKSVRGKKATLRISVPGSGRLEVAGKGIKTLKKKMSKAGAVTMVARLTRAADKKRLKKGVFRTRARVRFTPDAGAGVTTVVSLAFRTTQKKKGGK